MNKEFIPHKQSLDLQELGFDEPCLAFFEINNTHQPQNLRYFLKTAVNREYIENTKILKYIYGENSLLAPLYQQVFRWFREKYNLKEQYGTFPHHTIITNYLIDGGKEEEAELECLKKLIEICKDENIRKSP